MSTINGLERLQAERRANSSQHSAVAPPISKRDPLLTFTQLVTRDKETTILVRTGLSNTEFEYVVNLLERHPESLKRGRKLLELQVRLVIVLQWLHHGTTFQLIAESLGLTSSCVQTSITSLWNPLATALMKTSFPVALSSIIAQNYSLIILLQRVH